jgi:hypothetical protein
MTPRLRPLYTGGWLETPCLRATAQGIGAGAPPSGIGRKLRPRCSGGAGSDEAAVAAALATRALPPKAE